MQDVQAIVDSYPVYEKDLFSKEALDNPFPYYDEILELGPVVRIKCPGLDILAISRFDDVTKALQTPEILISGKGNGFNEFINQEVEEPGVLTSDGERHRKMRMMLMKYLSPAALKSMREPLETKADEHVRALAHGGTIEAMEELAAFLPISAVSEMVGLPEEDRVKMTRWASSSFNVVGPIMRDGELIPELAEDLQSAAEVIDYLANLDPTTLRPGSWSAELFNEVREGGMSLAHARISLRSFVLPSLDTTINGTGNLIYQLGINPEQFALLRENPSLISSAVYEGMRHSTIARCFSRYAVEDYIAGDVVIPKDERVMLLFGAANRDPRKYPNPERFDVTRNPASQLGWSAGPHLCAGKHLARYEMEAMLKAIVKYAQRLEADEPTSHSNRGVFGYSKLPVRLIPA